MILDQTIGVHHAQVEYLTMGWVQTWVSGEGVEPVAESPTTFPTLRGLTNATASLAGLHQLCCTRFSLTRGWRLS